jgi:hypothetical protein
MTATGMAPAQVADLDAMQVRVMLRQVQLDGEQRRLEGMVAAGQISADDANAAMGMVLEGDGDGEVRSQSDER